MIHDSDFNSDILASVDKSPTSQFDDHTQENGLWTTKKLFAPYHAFRSDIIIEAYAGGNDKTAGPLD
jgi:hypothetical protein